MIFICCCHYSISHTRDDPPSPPAPAPPSAASPSFFSSSFFSASLFAGAFAFASPPSAGFGSAAGGFVAAAGLALAEDSPAPAELVYYAEAFIACYIAASSSSIPYSKRKLAAISSFLSQAKKASAARAFENPRETRLLIDCISSGVT